MGEKDFMKNIWGKEFDMLEQRLSGEADIDSIIEQDSPTRDKGKRKEKNMPDQSKKEGCKRTPEKYV